MISLVEICDLTDPLLLPWLDLYETAFPPGERVLVSHVLAAVTAAGVLHQPACGVDHGSHLLAAVGNPVSVTRDEAAAHANSVVSQERESPQVDPAGSSFLGLVYYYEPDGCVATSGAQAAFLWYFAIEPQMRGQGLGAQLFQRLLERIDPRVRALIFDLEDPAQMETPERVKQAERRIAFYRRLGARVLGGISYVQTVGPHQPPLLLLLMVHPIQEISPREAFELARQEFGDEILKQVGKLSWE